MWSKGSFSHGHWMVDASVRVTGRLKNGADGMVTCVFWFDHPLPVSLSLAHHTKYTTNTHTQTHTPQQAIWFTSEPGQEGPVYGNSDTWKGLALFLDSFDNNGMVSQSPLSLSLSLSLSQPMALFWLQQSGL